MIMTLFAAAMAASTPAPGEPSLADLRALTERYRDVEAALADGYVKDPENICAVAAHTGHDPALGAMGIHYIRLDLLGIAGPPDGRIDGNGTHTDFRKPAILIYEPRADGSMDLVAVENLVFKKAWHEAGHKQPPSFHGIAYDEMADDPATEADEAHMFEPHYDRHVWIYRDNPNGVFAQYNPKVSCAHGKGGGGAATTH